MLTSCLRTLERGARARLPGGHGWPVAAHSAAAAAAAADNWRPLAERGGDGSFRRVRAAAHARDYRKHLARLPVGGGHTCYRQARQFQSLAKFSKSNFDLYKLTRFQLIARSLGDSFLLLSTGWCTKFEVYSTLIETMRLSCTVFEIPVEFRGATVKTNK